MKITRGLIIDDPWIGHILEGRKDWEMRSQATSHRGWFGLIRKGSGQVVGLARLTECGLALTPDEMILFYEHHRIPESMIRSGAVSKWVIPWKLADIRPLERPISYQHKSGAVTWVLFSDEVAVQLAQALDGTARNASSDHAPPTRNIADGHLTSIIERTAAKVPMTKPVSFTSTQFLSDTPHNLLGRSEITGGSLRNKYFRIGEFIDKFPADTIGGSNQDAAAPRQLTVHWGGPSPVMTDIDQTKRMFRKRGWVSQFFTAAGAREGDIVVVTSSAPYHIHVRIERQPASVLSDKLNSAPQMTNEI